METKDLKARAYDLLRAIEQYQAELNKVANEIARQEQEEIKKEEKTNKK